MNEIIFASAEEQLEALRSGKLSARESVDAALEQIDRLDSTLRAFLSVRHEEVRREADQLDQKFAKGERLPLHGLTLTIKDAIPTAGIKTTYGSVDFADYVPKEDVAYVRRLREAGALIVGKTSTPDLDKGGLTTGTRNELCGTTVSPWDTSRSSGGSSGGTAVAVATGMAALGVGSDNGGSIRHPAAHNGICGLRGTAGFISTYPNSWPLDTFSVAGPMCRTVGDLDLMLKVMTGGDPRSPMTPMAPYTGYEEGDPSKLRIAWSEDMDGLFRVDQDVRDALRRARRQMEGIGLQPKDEAPRLHGIKECITPLRSMRSVIRQIVRAERLGQPRPSTANFEKSSRITALEIAEAEITRSKIWAASIGFFERFDVLALPTTQTAGFDADTDYAMVVEGKPVDDVLDVCMSTYGITLMGWPCLSIPCGFNERGEPIGLQLVAPHGRESRLLALGHFLETRLDWTGHIPPLARG